MSYLDTGLNRVRKTINNHSISNNPSEIRKQYTRTRSERRRYTSLFRWPESINLTCRSGRLQTTLDSKLNSVVLVRERTISTERPPFVGEVNANFCSQRVPGGQRDRFLRPYSRLSRPEPLLFLPSSSSVVLTKLSGPRSRPTTSQKIW
jgi:hypothetical protein